MSVLDERPQQKVPMEVLNLGLCRTGTQTVADTLALLGYGRIHHMREVRSDSDLEFWTNAVKAVTNGETSKVPSTAEITDALSEYGGLCDVPGSLFFEQLLDAYPDAALIMSTRDVESWEKSVKTSVLSEQVKAAVRQRPGIFELMTALEGIWGHDFDANGRASFEKHDRDVRAAVSKRGRQIFVFEVSDKTAFTKLCKWLGREPPSEMTDFPNTDSFRKFRGGKAPGPPGGVQGTANNEAAE